ncbi:MAG: T9SS type A sorting domain-containing protein [bacterium]|nr:T9SS type A sorting domain-containing protein [bacterium]
MIQATPNPFNPMTEISFTLEQSQRLTIAVYDPSGRLVVALARDEFGPGRHVMTWDGRDHVGRAASSGVYFIRVTDGVQSRSEKVALVR